MSSVSERQIVLLISVFKWCVLGTLVGIVVGAAVAVFLKALDYAIAATGQHPYYFLLLPLTLLVSSALTKYLASEAEGHGTAVIIDALHKRSGRIKPSTVLVKLVATLITIASGGSAGKEEPGAQLGAGLSSLLADLLKFDDRDRRKLVICGVSAGFASVFGTPLGGAIFGVEVLFVGSLMYDVLLPAFVAGIVSYQVSAALGTTYFYSPLQFAPVFSGFFLVQVIVAGIFFGMVALLLIELFNLFKKAAERLTIGWIPAKGIIGGTMLVLLTLAFSTQYLGLGLQTTQATLQGQHAVWYAFLLKIVFTSITLGFGGTGGIITPIFFIGSTAGSVFAQGFGLNSATFAAIGLVAVLAGTTNTPIAASIVSVELFGPAVAPYAAVACVVSYVMSGHRSIYPSQVLATEKSRSIQVQIGKEVAKGEPTVQPRPGSITEVGLRVMYRIRDFGARHFRLRRR